MKNRAIRFLQQVNIIQTALLVAFIGLLGIVLAPVIPSIPPYLVATINSISCSLVAASALTLLTTPFLLKNQEIADMVETWGVVGIFLTRSEMNASTKVQFENTHHDLEYIAFGLKSLRDNQVAREIEQKVKKGMRVKILTMNPESPFISQREKEEGESPGSIKHQIVQLTEWMKKLYRFSRKSPEQVQLKYYDSMPQDFYCRQDDRIYVGPYQFDRQSQQSISYEFKGGSRGYAYYKAYFEQLWHNEDFCSPVKLDIEAA